MRALKILLLVLGLILAWLQYRLWMGEGGARAAAQLQQRVETQTLENRGLTQRNAQLAAEVENLKSGESAVEERARSELGMIKPGETFYRVVELPAERGQDDDQDGEPGAAQSQGNPQ